MDHKCSKCGEVKPASKFQLFNGKPSGQCRECKTAYMKTKRESEGVPVKKLSRIEGDEKLCTCCNEMKLLSEFSPCSRGLGGVSAYCRACFAAKYRNPEKAKAATVKYRTVNRERHLANHRVRMFEYRTKKKVTSDGTVTDDFLRALYGTEYCHYCLQYTEPEDRTADHVIALASEGRHTAGNLVMACNTCNSSKRDLSDEEFMNRGVLVW